MRAKATLIIIVIAFAITAADFGSSIFFTRQSLMLTIGQELSLARDIADSLVSTKISLLVANAQTVANRLTHVVSANRMEMIMRVQLDKFPEFIGFAVFDQEGVFAQCGISPAAAEEPYNTNYVRRALDGETIILTSESSVYTDELTIKVFVSIDKNYVLSVSIPGMIFSEILSGFTLWNFNPIFMLDKNGVLIAHYNNELVNKRSNFLDIPEITKSQMNTDFFNKMISSDEGMGYYSSGRGDCICAYKHISASSVNWYIAATVPMTHSPAATVQNRILLLALAFLVGSVIVAILVSGSVAHPYNKLKGLNESVKTQALEIQESHNSLQIAAVQLESALEKARDANNAKSEFLANMSHEMRTPLNAIIGLSALALESIDLNEELRSNLDKIYNAGMILLSIVNDILDISKIEAGKFELTPVEYDVPSLINDTIVQNILRIGEKPIQFILDIEESLPIKLYGDELRIKQIFNNLLSNAFKYTLEGTVELKVSCVRDGDDVWITASVRDTGIGIHHGDLAKLFSDYSQVDKKSNRRIEGTGLGLSITKRIVEMMQGSVDVESEYGKGSKFTVKFLQKSVTDGTIGQDIVKRLKSFQYIGQKREHNSQLARIRLNYARVLIVDDNETNLYVAKGMMKPYGMKIDCVTSGREAISIVHAEKVHYNAIFMDHMMPDIDGIEATRIIREEIKTEYAKTIPIIALTANAISGNEEMFLSKGFQAFISKPIKIKHLDAVLRQWVRDKEQEKKLDGQKDAEYILSDNGQTRKQSLGIIIPEIYREGLERFGGDEESFLQVLRSYAVNTAPLLEAVGEVDENSLYDYAIIVHGIKGSSRGISANAIGDMAEALENAAKAGDLGFVRANNPGFLEAARNHLAELNNIFVSADGQNPKPKKDKPDEKILAGLLTACQNFDIDKIDTLMSDIEVYEYTSDNGLAAWLRENVNLMNYDDIVKKLDE